MTGHNLFRSVVAIGLLATSDAPSRRAYADDPKTVVLEMKGYFVPTHQAAVGPVTGGRVAEVLVREGQKVKQGDVLARLDETPARLDLQRAEARVATAKARLGLHRVAAKEEAAARAVAEAEVEEALAVLKKAAYVLDTLTVRAPFDGTVLAVRVEAGSYVNPLAFAAAGHVCEIARPGLEVEVDVGERDLFRVFPGQPCRIQSDANPKVVYQGKVVRLLPVANRAKGSVGVRVAVEIPGNDDSVRPEMAAVVSFLKKE
jgi:RND family efflux transporter MFP subunit